jgi:hypothetical protein
MVSEHALSDMAVADIVQDDTVKHTDILSGPREVFRNVFCRDLNDSCVEGMDELYAQLDREGLSGLHFVVSRILLRVSLLFPLTHSLSPTRHSSSTPRCATSSPDTPSQPTTASS